LEVATEWSLVAYLCVGYPQEEHIDPELERYGWQTSADKKALRKVRSIPASTPAKPASASRLATPGF